MSQAWNTIRSPFLYRLPSVPRPLARVGSAVSASLAEQLNIGCIYPAAAAAAAAFINVVASVSYAEQINDAGRMRPKYYSQLIYGPRQSTDTKLIGCMKSDKHRCMRKVLKLLCVDHRTSVKKFAISRAAGIA
jgi:hypothetical protein